MTLRITYELTCDFCTGRVGKVEEFNMNVFVPVSNMALPQPRITGNCIGQNVVCDRCQRIGFNAIMKAREERGLHE